MPSCIINIILIFIVIVVNIVSIINYINRTWTHNDTLNLVNQTENETRSVKPIKTNTRPVFEKKTCALDMIMILIPAKLLLTHIH